MPHLRIYTIHVKDAVRILPEDKLKNIAKISGCVSYMKNYASTKKFNTKNKYIFVKYSSNLIIIIIVIVVIVVVVEYS